MATPSTTTTLPKLCNDVWNDIRLSQADHGLRNASNSDDSAWCFVSLGICAPAVRMGLRPHKPPNRLLHHLPTLHLLQRPPRHLVSGPLCRMIRRGVEFCQMGLLGHEMSMMALNSGHQLMPCHPYFGHGNGGHINSFPASHPSVGKVVLNGRRSPSPSIGPNGLPGPKPNGNWINVGMNIGWEQQQWQGRWSPSGEWGGRLGAGPTKNYMYVLLAPYHSLILSHLHRSSTQLSFPSPLFKKPTELAMEINLTDFTRFRCAITLHTPGGMLTRVRLLQWSVLIAASLAVWNQRPKDESAALAEGVVPVLVSSVEHMSPNTPNSRQ